MVWVFIKVMFCIMYMLVLPGCVFDFAFMRYLML